MKMVINDIIIHERIRRETQDMSDLVDSIRKIGLIHPVIVNEKNELMSGFRRLQACKEMGWESIEVKVVSTGDDALFKLDWEYHENLGREGLSPSDQAHYTEMRQTILNPPKPGWWKRLWCYIRNLFKKK